MSGTGYVIGPQIPQGLAVIVEGLAREVLRHQPTDIYTFAAHHFEQLMKLREKGRNVEIIPQVFDLIEKTATITPIPTCKVARKQREATNGGCGWSINRTVKVFKKHEFNRDVKNMEAGKKIADDYSVTRSAGSWKETRSICGQLVRSSSVGDLQFRKDVGRPFDEYNVSKRYARGMDNKYEKRLERQKSTGEIEGTRRPVIITGERSRNNGNGGIDRNRSRSVVNDRSKWYESDVGERTRRYGGTTVSGGGTFRGYRNGRDRGGSKSASNEQRERKKLEGNFQNKQDMKINRLKLRSGETEGDSKESGDRERMLITEMIDRHDWESLNDSSRAKSFDVANVTNKTDGCWPCNEEDIVISTVRKNRSEDNLIVFPSVDTRQCSSRCLTNEKHHELDEPFSRSDFILPPISNDSLKSIKRSADLTLPFLSNERATNTSVCDGSPRDPNNCNTHNTRLQLKSTNSFDHEPTSGTQYELTCSTSNDDIANDCKRESDNLIGNDIVCWNDSRLTSGWDESKNENKNGNGNGNDNEKGKVRKDDDKDGAIVLPTSMIIGQSIVGSKEVAKQVENTRWLDSRETDIEEVFRDSLNVTPDSIECSQRSDSFDEETGERRNRSNELKQKLIEIETVERNIENTLVSSGTTTIPFNNVDEKTALVKCLVDSDVEACKWPRENDAILAIDTSHETSGEKESIGENQQPSKVRRNDVPEMFNRRNSNVSSNTHDPIAKDDDVYAIPVSEKSLPAKSLVEIDDPSCYVLTEGSPCEIPDSVTTVIIPDRNVLRDDEMVELLKEKIVREACSMRRVSYRDSDSDSDTDTDTNTWKRPTEEFQRYNQDPVFFGDRVSPRAFHCPTSIKLHFLRGMTDTVDRTIASHHERQQKQQQQQQQQQELGNINEEAEGDHAGDDASCIELCETARGKNRDVSISSCKDKETSCVAENIDKYLKEDESRTCDDRLDYFCRSLDEDRPYVPELNLNSLRDVTISSFGISDSTESVEDRWKKEERNEQEETDDIHFHEIENTLSSFDTFISEEKMTIDDGSTMALSSSKSEFLPEERSSNRKDERSKINNETDNYDIDSKEVWNTGRPVCSAHGGNSLNIEEEIAKELIRNLILETPEVQERTDTGNVFELNKSNDDEMEGEEQKQEKEEGKDDDDDDDVDDDEVKKDENKDKESIGKHYSLMTSQRISDDENNPSCSSSFVFLESADPSIIEFDNVFKEERDVIEKMSTDLYTQKGKFEATTRRIQSWSNISALGSRQLLQVDERQDQNDSPQATPTLNVTMCLIPKPEQEQVAKKSTEWPMNGNRNRSDLRHTGEFHDSLPLPIFDISNIISTNEVHAANIIQKKMLPASTRTTTTTTRAAATATATATATITTTAAATAMDSWFTVDSSYIAYEALTADPDTKICFVSKSTTPRTTVLYTTDFTKDLGSLESKKLLMNSSGNSNFLPSIVRIERIVDDTNCAILVRSAVDTLDSDIDDLREPLALDDGEPKLSVVIEEILVDGKKEENERWKKEEVEEDGEDEEDQQTLSYSCEMKRDFVKTDSLLSDDSYCNRNDGKDNNTVAIYKANNDRSNIDGD